MTNYIQLAIAVLVGIIFCYLVLRPRLKKIEDHNEDIRQEYQQLIADKQRETGHLYDLQTAISQAMVQQTALETAIREKENSAEELYNSKIHLLEERMDREAEDMSRKYQKAEEEAKDEYLKMLQQLSLEFSTESILSHEQIIKLRAELEDIKSKRNAAVEEYKRALEMEQQREFYRLSLSDVDIEEIKKIREIEKYLRDARPLNKVIWSVYYEHPYTDLVGRVVGAGRHTGIYKLTNIENGMVYVGQAVNIADRWKQHIKCAIGAENAPNNKLYPVMHAIGPENFTFEVIEECEQEKLNEREQYWQDFYKAKEFGYSVR